MPTSLSASVPTKPSVLIILWGGPPLPLSIHITDLTPLIRWCYLQSLSKIHPGLPTGLDKRVYHRNYVGAKGKSDAHNAWHGVTSAHTPNDVDRYSQGCNHNSHPKLFRRRRYHPTHTNGQVVLLLGRTNHDNQFALLFQLTRNTLFYLFYSF